MGSLESVSNDYGSGSALKISDAELTSLDLDIVGQNTSSKAYDGNGVLRARGHLKSGEPKSDNSAGQCGQLRECIITTRRMWQQP